MKLQTVLTSLLAVTIVACSTETESEKVGTDVTSETTVVHEEDSAAYVVFNYRISDRAAYNPYLAEVPRILEAHGAEIIVADFESEEIEGDAGEVTVVLKFASREAATSWYQSPEYQAIIGLRTANSDGIATLASSADD